MNENYYCVLVSPKKYKEMLEEINGFKYIHLPQKENKNNYVESVETIRSLPVEIFTVINEDIRYVTKEEYDELEKESIKQFEEFMKNYEPDYMWR